MKGKTFVDGLCTLPYCVTPNNYSLNSSDAHGNRHKWTVKKKTNYDKNLDLKDTFIAQEKMHSLGLHFDVHSSEVSLLFPHNLRKPS